MRATGSGITSYDYIPEKDLVVVHGPRCTVLERETVSVALNSGLSVVSSRRKNDCTSLSWVGGVCGRVPRACRSSGSSALSQLCEDDGLCL